MERILQPCDMIFEGSSKERCLKDFRRITSLGQGSYAKVFKVETIKTKKIYAMKQINKNRILMHGLTGYIESEIEIMKKVHHQNIVKLYCYFEDDVNFYLIMEFAENG